MKRNVHTVDKIIRIIVGLILLSLCILGPKSWWGLLGLIPLITGIIGNCPIYSIFGFSTCSSQKTEEKEEASSPGEEEQSTTNQD